MNLKQELKTFICQNKGKTSFNLLSLSETMKAVLKKKFAFLFPLFLEEKFFPLFFSLDTDKKVSDLHKKENDHFVCFYGKILRKEKPFLYIIEEKKSCISCNKVVETVTDFFFYQRKIKKTSSCICEDSQKETKKNILPCFKLWVGVPESEEYQIVVLCSLKEGQNLKEDQIIVVSGLQKQETFDQEKKEQTFFIYASKIVEKKKNKLNKTELILPLEQEADAFFETLWGLRTQKTGLFLCLLSQELQKQNPFMFSLTLQGLVLGNPGVGKCLSGKTRVLLPENNELELSFFEPFFEKKDFLPCSFPCISFNLQNSQKEVDEVVGVCRTKIEQSYILFFKNFGSTIECSLDHTFFIQKNELVPTKARDLKVGDLALTGEGVFELVKIEPRKGGVFYDLQVKKNKTFIANGIITHNSTFIENIRSKEIPQELGTGELVSEVGLGSGLSSFEKEFVIEKGLLEKADGKLLLFDELDKLSFVQQKLILKSWTANLISFSKANIYHAAPFEPCFLFFGNLKKAEELNISTAKRSFFFPFFSMFEIKTFIPRTEDIPLEFYTSFQKTKKELPFIKLVFFSEDWMVAPNELILFADAVLHTFFFEEDLPQELKSDIFVFCKNIFKLCFVISQSLKKKIFSYEVLSLAKSLIYPQQKYLHKQFIEIYKKLEKIENELSTT